MENKPLTLKERRQRRLLLLLPVMALPFTTLFFWALGGGSATAGTGDATVQKGINSSLPIPDFKNEKPLDKLSYYDRAKEDSLKHGSYENYRNDYREASETSRDTVTGGQPMLGLGQLSYRNASEQKVYQRLHELQRALDNPPHSQGRPQEPMPAHNPDVRQLEAMMATGEPAEADPELQQLGSMLETIVDIQHPERVAERTRRQSQQMRGQVFPVTAPETPQYISLLEGQPSSLIAESGFHPAWEDRAEQVQHNAITAVIHEDQTLVNGSIVKMRLVADVMVNGVLIRSGSFIFGEASLKGERLAIQISSLQHKGSIFQVDLAVYDLDGMEGINIPGALTRDVAKSSAQRSIQGVGVSPIDNSWSAQAAGAGIEAAKTLFSKKAKLVKVMLKAGYRVLLYDERSNRKK